MFAVPGWMSEPSKARFKQGVGVVVGGDVAAAPVGDVEGLAEAGGIPGRRERLDLDVDPDLLQVVLDDLRARRGQRGRAADVHDGIPVPRVSGGQRPGLF